MTDLPSVVLVIRILLSIPLIVGLIGVSVATLKLREQIDTTRVSEKWLVSYFNSLSIEERATWKRHPLTEEGPTSDSKKSG
jgi:hypothetical protein